MSTPAGPFLFPNRPRTGRMVDFVDLADTGTGTAFTQNLAPVSANQCIPIACELTVQIRRGRLIDWVGTRASGKSGVPPAVTPVGKIPVFGLPPPECCEGDNEMVETLCSPGQFPKQMFMQLGYPVGFGHCDPPCGLVTLTYNEGVGLTGTGSGTDDQPAWFGSAKFKAGTMDFRLSCSNRGLGPEMKLEGTGCGTLTAWTGTVCVPPSEVIFMLVGAQAIGSGCCDWPLTSQELSATIIGACGFLRATRFVDMESKTVVGAFTKCCNNIAQDAAPPCCARLNKTIVVEVTSECSTFDGATFTLVAGDSGSPDVWYDEISKDGTTITCALSCDNMRAGNTFVSPCDIPTTDNYCNPQGYEACDKRSYLSGAIHVNLTCTGVSNPGMLGGVSICGECNCGGEGEPLDFTVSVGAGDVSGTKESLLCTDSGGPCCCTFIGERFGFSIHVTE